MEFEQDYIMRMIKSIVSFFIKLITGKSDTVYELPSDGLYTPCDDIFARTFPSQTAEKSTKPRTFYTQMSNLTAKTIC